MITIDKSKTSFRANGRKLLNFQNYVRRVAGVFGLAVRQEEVVLPPEHINIDYVHSRLKSLVHARSKGSVLGQSNEFHKLIKASGFTTISADEYNHVVTGFVIDGFDGYNMNLAFDEFTVDGFDDAYVQVQVTDSDDIGVVISGSADVGETLLSLDGFDPEKTYFMRYRGVWNDGDSYSKWSDVIECGGFVLGPLLQDIGYDNPDFTFEFAAFSPVGDYDDVEYFWDILRVDNNNSVDDGSVLNGDPLVFLSDQVETNFDYIVRIRAAWDDNNKLSTWSTNAYNYEENLFAADFAVSSHNGFEMQFNWTTFTKLGFADGKIDIEVSDHNGYTRVYLAGIGINQLVIEELVPDVTYYIRHRSTWDNGTNHGPWSEELTCFNNLSLGPVISDTGYDDPNFTISIQNPTIINYNDFTFSWEILRALDLVSMDDGISLDGEISTTALTLDVAYLLRVTAFWKDGAFYSDLAQNDFTISD